MNLGDSTPTTSVVDRPQYGYASSESESRHVSGGSGKKRASRAGTRSVSTLSAAQLERKRANDREAQRAIRQRTKDHIESLERNISDLRAAHDASEKMAAVAHQRSRELEDENVYLRTKLGEVGYPMAVPPESRLLCNIALFSAHLRIHRPSRSRARSVTGACNISRNSGTGCEHTTPGFYIYSKKHAIHQYIAVFQLSTRLVATRAGAIFRDSRKCSCNSTCTLVNPIGAGTYELEIA
jgi:hypothetical protein